MIIIPKNKDRANKYVNKFRNSDTRKQIKNGDSYTVNSAVGNSSSVKFS